MLHTSSSVFEVWYCVPGMAIDTSSGTGRRQPMVYYCWASSPYDAMDFASEAGSLQGLSTTDRWYNCSVVVKLASLVVSWGGNRPPINVFVGRLHE